MLLGSRIFANNLTAQQFCQQYGASKTVRCCVNITVLSSIKAHPFQTDQMNDDFIGGAQIHEQVGGVQVAMHDPSGFQLG